MKTNKIEKTFGLFLINFVFVSGLFAVQQGWGAWAKQKAETAASTIKKTADTTAAAAVGKVGAATKKVEEIGGKGISYALEVGTKKAAYPSTSKINFRIFNGTDSMLSINLGTLPLDNSLVNSLLSLKQNETLSLPINTKKDLVFTLYQNGYTDGSVAINFVIPNELVARDKTVYLEWDGTVLRPESNPGDGYTAIKGGEPIRYSLVNNISKTILPQLPPMAGVTQQEMVVKTEEVAPTIVTPPVPPALPAVKAPMAPPPPPPPPMTKQKIKEKTTAVKSQKGVEAVKPQKGVGFLEELAKGRSLKKTDLTKKEVQPTIQSDLEKAIAKRRGPIKGIDEESQEEEWK